MLNISEYQQSLPQHPEATSSKYPQSQKIVFVNINPVQVLGNENQIVLKPTNKSTVNTGKPQVGVLSTENKAATEGEPSR